jgi:ATP-binding cassette subfamily A (ABC1) protein 1
MYVLGLLYSVAAMIGYVTKEKELRQKELMKMMSVTESDIGWAWFMSFFLFYFFVSIIVGIASTKLYEQSELLLLIIFWVLTFLSLVVFTLFLATLTSKSTRGVLIGLLVFFVGVFLTLAVSFEDGDSVKIDIISLHPVSAFSYGIQQIGLLEDQGIGLTSSTLDKSDNASGYSVINSFQSLIFDSILWGIATWYLNRVIKPDYGQALPFYFPFTKVYWCPGSATAPMVSTHPEEGAIDEGAPFEPVSDALKKQGAEGRNIEIHGLRKTFGEKTAVDGLSLSMYSGQITALLGHNGAGKTTLMSMLTGAVAPTEGYATVAGKDIRTQTQQIREDIGICLQHDCLFPQLTVREHVQFFSRIKGLYNELSNEEAEEHIDQVIQDVALSEKRNTFSRNLSGGMKRKLSVAIAFCGGSKIVLLDEPTSGMVRIKRKQSALVFYYCVPLVSFVMLRSAAFLSIGPLFETLHLERDSPVPSESLHHPNDAFYGRSGHSGRPHRHHGRRSASLRWQFTILEEALRCWLSVDDRKE